MNELVIIGKSLLFFFFIYAFLLRCYKLDPMKNLLKFHDSIILCNLNTCSRFHHEYFLISFLLVLLIVFLFIKFYLDTKYKMLQHYYKIKIRD